MNNLFRRGVLLLLRSALRKSGYLALSVSVGIKIGPGLSLVLLGHPGTDLSEEIPSFRFRLSSCLLSAYFPELRWIERPRDKSKPHPKLMPWGRLLCYCAAHLTHTGRTSTVAPLLPREAPMKWLIGKRKWHPKKNTRKSENIPRGGWNNGSATLIWKDRYQLKAYRDRDKISHHFVIKSKSSTSKYAWTMVTKLQKPMGMI